MAAITAPTAAWAAGVRVAHRSSGIGGVAGMAESCGLDTPGQVHCGSARPALFHTSVTLGNCSAAGRRHFHVAPQADRPRAGPPRTAPEVAPECPNLPATGD